MYFKAGLFNSISSLLYHRIAPDRPERRIWAAKKSFAQKFLHPITLLYQLVPQISMDHLFHTIFITIQETQTADIFHRHVNLFVVCQYYEYDTMNFEL